MKVVPFDRLYMVSYEHVYSQ